MNLVTIHYALAALFALAWSISIGIAWAREPDRVAADKAANISLVSLGGICLNLAVSFFTCGQETGLVTLGVTLGGIICFAFPAVAIGKWRSRRNREKGT